MKLSDRDDIIKWMQHEIRCVRSEESIVFTAQFSEAFPKIVVLGIAEKFDITDLDIINDFWMLLGKTGYEYERIKKSRENAPKKKAVILKGLDRVQKRTANLMQELSFESSEPTGEKIATILQDGVELYARIRSETIEPIRILNDGQMWINEFEQDPEEVSFDTILTQLKHLDEIISLMRDRYSVPLRKRVPDYALRHFLKFTMRFWAYRLGEEIRTDHNDEVLYTDAELFAGACLKPLGSFSDSTIKTYLRDLRTDGFKH